MEAVAERLPRASDDRAAPDPLDFAPGENFPVASRLIRRDLRPAVMAFYRYARAADDVADHPGLSVSSKLDRLGEFEAGLVEGAGDDHAVVLRLTLAAHPRGRELNRCALTLLGAFRQDARGADYPDWETLRAYCAMSADPVGRFLLHLHEEGPETHSSSDALCTALQVLNHLQDIRPDREALGRVYLPGTWLADAGATPADLSSPYLSDAIRMAIHRTLDACDALLREAGPLPGLIRSRGLRAQAAATLFLARRLSARLRRGDPLAGRIRPSRSDFALAGGLGVWRAVRRPS